jgi:hypothetical protein
MQTKFPQKTKSKKNDLRGRKKNQLKPAQKNKDDSRQSH